MGVPQYRIASRLSGGVGCQPRRITLSPRLTPGDAATPRRGVAASLTAQLSLAPLQWGSFFNDKNPEKTDAGARLRRC